MCYEGRTSSRALDTANSGLAARVKLSSSPRLRRQPEKLLCIAATLLRRSCRCLQDTVVQVLFPFKLMIGGGCVTRIEVVEQRPGGRLGAARVSRGVLHRLALPDHGADVRFQPPQITFDRAGGVGPGHSGWPVARHDVGGMTRRQGSKSFQPPDELAIEGRHMSGKEQIAQNQVPVSSSKTVRSELACAVGQASTRRRRRPRSSSALSATIRVGDTMRVPANASSPISRRVAARYDSLWAASASGRLRCPTKTAPSASKAALPSM